MIWCYSLLVIYRAKSTNYSAAIAVHLALCWQASEDEPVPNCGSPTLWKALCYGNTDGQSPNNAYDSDIIVCSFNPLVDLYSYAAKFPMFVSSKFEWSARHQPVFGGVLCSTVIVWWWSIQAVWPERGSTGILLHTAAHYSSCLSE